MGRRPEFVDPKVIAFNSGRESKIYIKLFYLYIKSFF
jgi:hypothetical protein